MKHFVVRQAIKAADADTILGYELLFERGGESLYGEKENAAADTIASFLMNNSGKIFKDKQIFLTFTPALLLRNTPKIFRKDKIIIQISDNLIIHPLAMPIIEKFHKAGYRFAINDFQFSPRYFSMLDYADYVRLSMKETLSAKDMTSIENIINMAHGFGKKCIMTEVNTKEGYEKALSVKADYIEGNYVAETLYVKEEKTSYMQGNLFQLIVALSKEEPDVAEIEEIISRDAGLSYSILKLVNSAYYALRHRTASIQQAVMTMGISQLRQWVYMLSLRGDESEGSGEMLRISFLRAKFAEELIANTEMKFLTPAEAYMMGMFSTLEYMIDAPIEEILAEIPVSDDIKAAIIRGEGDAGKLLELVICYEKADWKRCQVLSEELGLQASRLSQIYINCVEEVSTVWDSLTEDYARPGEGGLFAPQTGTDGEKLEDVLQ